MRDQYLAQTDRLMYVFRAVCTSKPSRDELAWYIEQVGESMRQAANAALCASERFPKPTTGDDVDIAILREMLADAIRERDAERDEVSRLRAKLLASSASEVDVLRDAMWLMADGFCSTRTECVGCPVRSECNDWDNKLLGPTLLARHYFNQAEMVCAGEIANERWWEV